MHGTPETAADDTLLRILSGRGKWKVSPEAIRASAVQARVELAAHLVASHLATRQDVVKSLLDIKGVYACHVGGEFVEARISRAVPIEAALSAGLWPLAAVGTRLYALTATDAPVHAVVKIDEALTFHVVSLGTIPDVRMKARGCYAVLSRIEPDGRNFQEFLGSFRLQKELVKSNRHESGPGQGTATQKAGSDEELVQARGAYSDLPVVDQRRIEDLLDPQVLGRALANAPQPPNLLPLRVEHGVLWVVSDKFPDPTLLDALATKVECRRTQLFVATTSAIAAAAAAAEAGSDSPTHSRGGPDDSSVPAITGHLLLEGVLRHCSDIHIERYEDRVDVRLRRDGNLFRYSNSGVTPENVQNVVSLLKVAGSLDIAETRRPQDGVIRQKFGERSVDYRVATQPTIWGENIVLRILEQSTPPKLDGLGFDQPQLARLRRLLANPQGLLLVTGPTGSGKTTTLYAILQELKNPEIKILTAEDPVEYAIDGIQQSAVNEPIGDTFARYIRAFLRQDPDVILVGEIRDEETAEAAVRAALTGHLVLSTLHANDVIGVVRRISDLGVEQSLVAQTLEGVIGQRLARKVCSNCAEPYLPPPELVREFYPHGVPDGATFRKGLGCTHCRQTGYSGRFAVVEFWTPDEAARNVMDANGHPAALRKAAAEAGFEPLIVKAVRQAAAGLTTLEELRSIVPYEYVVRHALGVEGAALSVVNPKAGQAP